MKAPDTIYLEPYLDNPDKLHPSWYRNDIIGSGTEYIRKDLVEHIIRGALGPQDALNKIRSL